MTHSHKNSQTNIKQIDEIDNCALRWARVNNLNMALGIHVHVQACHRTLLPKVSERNANWRCEKRNKRKFSKRITM